MTYTNEYTDALLQLREDMEDMTYDEKMDFCRVRTIVGIKGYQDAMVSIEEMMTLQEQRIEELERTTSCDTVRLHVTMFMVCVLCYIYGTYLGLYLGRK